MEFYCIAVNLIVLCFLCFVATPCNYQSRAFVLVYVVVLVLVLVILDDIAYNANTVRVQDRAP